MSEIIGLVLDRQFEFSEKILFNKTNKKLYIYAFETVLQLYIAESMEHIREMYIASYSLPYSLHKVHKLLTIKLEEVFKEKLSKYDTKDFYELEIASAGIMRGYLSVPCDMYFTMDRKINRFIESNFRIYKVEEDTIKEILEFLKQFDFKSIADDVLKHLFEYLERRIKGE